VKANADLELAVDALLQAENLDYVLLETGDGDFMRLVRALQSESTTRFGPFPASSRLSWSTASRTAAPLAVSVARASSPGEKNCVIAASDRRAPRLAAGESRPRSHPMHWLPE